MAPTSIGIMNMAVRGDLSIPYVQNLAKAPGSVSLAEPTFAESNIASGTLCATVIHPAPLIRWCKVGKYKSMRARMLLAPTEWPRT